MGKNVVVPCFGCNNDRLFPEKHSKIPKISAGALFEGGIFGGALIGRESKFTIFALFYFVFEGKFPNTSPQGAYIRRGLFWEFYST